MPCHLLAGGLIDVRMVEARTCLHRVFLLSSLVLALAPVGCAPGLHQVRLRTADGQVRTTTPHPRAPLALNDEQVHKAVQVLARQVVPAADPLETCRQKFEMPAPPPSPARATAP